jgi:hypothetical protein
VFLLRKIHQVTKLGPSLGNLLLDAATASSYPLLLAKGWPGQQ